MMANTVDCTDDPVLSYGRVKGVSRVKCLSGVEPRPTSQVTSLMANTGYDLRVAAFNAAGTGSPHP